MKIIIEGYQYREEDVRSALKGLEPFAKDGKISVDYVGYFFNKEIDDCIFFLPKVILNEKDEVFGNENIKPEKIVDLAKAREEGVLSLDDFNFISNFTVWIYRAIHEFYRLNSNSEILLRKTFSAVDSSTHRVVGTLLDVILSLIKFNRENQDFFLYIIKNVHTGYNKINWNKTISKCTPFLQNGSPVYLNPVNKKKQINFDEELIVIFFSILNYIKKFGYTTPVNFNYGLIKDNQFENYLAGFGVVRLRQIKYKYLSDKALLLWNLCYAFFELSETIHSSDQQSDYLLARNFNIVFEAIIDELLSDKENVPTALKEQQDGKIVDHIYPYQSLLNDSDIYYIGDSKYYKIGAGLGENSVYKQYTYAKNVIQYNINVFFNNKGNALRYRDELTEGYNVTPNFFISAEVPADRSYLDANLNLREGSKYLNRQFNNRLFDRDTLWLSHYDVNFLFVLSLYAQSNDAAKAVFKEKARKTFTEHIISLLNKEYDFFVLSPINDLTEAINSNFKRLNGKVFRPLEDENIVVMALNKADMVENFGLLRDMKFYFRIKSYELGRPYSSYVDGYSQKLKTKTKPDVELRQVADSHSTDGTSPSHSVVGFKRGNK